MRSFFYLSVLIILYSCSSEKTKTDQQQQEEVETIDPRLLDVIPPGESEDTEPEKELFPVPHGTYYKAQEDGFIKLVIRPGKDSLTQFVFDAWGAGHAKIAGDMVIGEYGRADFKMPGCKDLNFHFTANGISVKEYDCNFHSKNFPFDGLYKKIEPIALSQAEINTMVKDFESEKKKFDLYAVFTEPFYTIYFKDDLVFIHSYEMDSKAYRLIRRFDPREESQRLYYIGKDGAYKFFVVNKGDGSDGMSEIDYPYDVRWGELYGGGGPEFQKE